MAEQPLAAVPEVAPEALAELRRELGPERVLTDPQSLDLYGQDVSGDSHPALLVVRPKDTAQLAAAVRFAAAQDLVVVPRGGGMSYSGGYVCHQPNVLTVDLGDMNQILEINTEDMYVTVQAGCTWMALHEALEPQGVRTPFWGTLSGITATVGGGMSQNSIFWGSGKHGSAVDSAVSMDVVLASGEVLSTGAGGQAQANPFFRHYGPDLTGLFTCDTGALGIKATVTLKLVPILPGRAFVSADFAEGPALIAALSEVSRNRLADACFGFDPVMQGQRMKRESLAKDVKALGNVMKSQGSMLKGLKEGAKVALAGRGFMKDVDYSVHFMVEEPTQAGADASAARIREIVAAHRGKDIENSIPKIARANPFGPLNSMIGPAGERWLPVHVLVPHSKAADVFAQLEALVEANGSVLDAHDILVGYLLTYIDTNAFVIEPVFYWPDALNDLHRAHVEDATLAKINDYPENLPARAEVMRLRTEMMTMFREAGGAHLQIGRRYQYQEGLRPANAQLIGELKALLDPDGRINPGSLGLAAG
jgi:FAD/FMN-containing dehydrogenase